MLYHKPSQTAFVLVSRAASTALKKYLIEIGFKYPLVFAPNKAGYYSHATYAAAIAQYPNLANYTTYGVFRDPLDRFLSALRFLWKNSVDNPSVVGHDISLCSSYDEIVHEIFNWDPQFQTGSEFTQEVFAPQTDWLAENVQIIDYRDIGNQIRSITATQNSSGLEFRRTNASPTHSFAAASDTVRQFVKSRYAADYSLAAANSIGVPSA